MADSLYSLADLSTAVYAKIENNSVLWPQAEVTAVINEAIAAVNLMTGFYQGTLTLISQAGKLVYQVPDGMLYPQRVQFEGTQLDPLSISQLGQHYRTWYSDNTVKSGPVARWSPIGINYFVINPADSIGGGRIDITGVLETPALVNPEDKMVLNDQFVDIIGEYGGHRLPLKVGGPTFSQASQLYSKGFIPQMKVLTQFQSIKFPQYFVKTGVPDSPGKTQ